MHLRTLAAISCLVFAAPLVAQVTVSRGVNLSIDAATDGRLAIDLLGDVWIVPDGGGEARQLTHDLKSAQRPRWSPDNQQLAYQAIADGQRGIWIYDLSDDSTRRLNSGGSFALHPSWHPDGEKILYSSDVDGDGLDLWEYDVATDLYWRISDRPGDETEGAWSSDGRDLVYVHHKAGQWSLVLRRHAQPEEILVTSTGRIAAPAWRPNGSLITYFNSGPGGTNIEMVILSQPRLIRSYANKEQFVLSPVSWLDDHRMYYSANGQIRQRLFDSWTSSPLHFRATLQPEVVSTKDRERAPLAWHDEPGGRFVIHAARVFDGLSTGYLYGKDILLDGGRIASIEEHQERPGAIVIDMGDLTILPGLIDADARLPAGLTPGHGPDLLTMGVTTVVATHDEAERLNKLWSGKKVPGPRLLTSEKWGIEATPSPELDVTAAVITSRATGLPTGTALPGQIRAMRIAGLTPTQTLRAMGVNAAAAMLADPYLGRIATGAAADLIFVDGDPLADASDALNVIAVVRNGRFYSVSGLVDRARGAQNVE